jgi:hypothetical protein
MTFMDIRQNIPKNSNLSLLLICINACDHMKFTCLSARLNLISLLVVIVIGITSNSVFGLSVHQIDLPDSIDNTIYDSDIHTILLRNATWELSLPVITLNSNDQIELRFDDLSGKNRAFGYILVHCDANWDVSSVSEQEYLTGYGQGTIKETSFSINTNYNYIHYRLVLPEEDCMPVISGNYGLIVYSLDDRDEIAFTRRFYITEKSATIEASVGQPLNGQAKETGQQVTFSVFFNSGEIRDPAHDLCVRVFQNDRNNRMIVPERPYDKRPGQLDYTYPYGCVFDGGNEFRSLDLKSMKYQTENVARIELVYPYYHVTMKNDEWRSGKPYFSKTDLNGAFFIDREKADNKHIEADYVFVHFRLKLPSVFAGEEIYVTGGFNDWKKEEKNRMKYNNETGVFELVTLLKQGLYDYCFETRDSESHKINEYEIEGNHYETENDYSLFLYYHDRHLGCDRLMTYQPVK